MLSDLETTMVPLSKVLELAASAMRRCSTIGCLAQPDALRHLLCAVCCEQQRVFERSSGHQWSPLWCEAVLASS